MSAVRVTDVRVADATAEQVERVRTLLGEHGVVVLPDQHDLDDEGFLEFLHRFGEVVPPVGETPVDGCPELNVISNVGRETPPRSTFHVDTSYVARPPAYTALRAVTLPARGGETLFTDQYRAHDDLPTDLRDDLAARVMTHAEGEESAQHPLLRPHPLTGRTALYLTTPARCAAISGLSQQVKDALVADLLERSTREANTHRHAWSDGDVVMWDNGVVLHRADHADVDGDRVMHRGMVR